MLCPLVAAGGKAYSTVGYRPEAAVQAEHNMLLPFAGTIALLVRTR